MQRKQVTPKSRTRSETQPSPRGLGRPARFQGGTQARALRHRCVLRPIGGVLLFPSTSVYVHGRHYCVGGGATDGCRNHRPLPTAHRRRNCLENAGLVRSDRKRPDRARPVHVGASRSLGLLRELRPFSPRGSARNEGFTRVLSGARKPPRRVLTGRELALNNSRPLAWKEGPAEDRCASRRDRKRSPTDRCVWVHRYPDCSSSGRPLFGCSRAFVARGLPYRERPSAGSH